MLAALTMALIVTRVACGDVDLVPEAGIALDGDTADWANIAVTAKDAAGDAHSQAPDLQELKVAADQQRLFVMVRSDYAPRHAGKSEKWHHSVSSFELGFDGSNMAPLAVQVRGTPQGLEASPEGVRAIASEDGTCVEIAVPLKLIGDNPTRCVLRSGIVHFATETMVGYEGSDRLPSTGELTLQVPSLPLDSQAPEMATAKVQRAGADHAVITWQTDEKADTRLTLHSDGKQVRAIAKPWLQRQHRLYLAGLSPGTEYSVKMQSADLAGNVSEELAQSFTTLASNPSILELGDRWLRVEGRHIVDAAGVPFKMAGYGQTLIPKYTTPLAIKKIGDLDEWCNYSKQRGMNCFRVAVPQRGAWYSNFDMDEYGGADRFVEQVVDPFVQACKRNGIYAVIDAHTGIMKRENYYKMIPFWQAVARRYKDEPWVAVYELWNEPHTRAFGLSPASGPPIRQWYADCIKAIREIDKRHIIMVSDWNAGWGGATESMWASAKFRPDEPYNQVIFSKHIAKSHCTSEFLTAYVDEVSQKWDVPVLVGEFELGPTFMTEEAFRFYLDWLRDNPGKYGWWAWDLGVSGIWDHLVKPFFPRWASPIPGFPATDKFVFEDFEGMDAFKYQTWLAGGGGGTPVKAELVAPGCESWGKCMRITFGPKSDKPTWAAVWTSWVFPARWAPLKPDRLTFTLKGDGTPASRFMLQVCLGPGRFSGPKHRASVSLEDTNWHQVVLHGSDFTPPIEDFATTNRIQFNGGSAPVKVTFSVDNIQLEQPIVLTD